MKTILIAAALIGFLAPSGLACFYNSSHAMDVDEQGLRTDIYDELPIVTEQNWHKKRMSLEKGRFPSSVTPEEEQFMKKGFYFVDPETGRTCLQIGDETDCELDDTDK